MRNFLNKINTITKLIVFSAMFLFYPVLAFAGNEDNLIVVFEQDPLFGEVNILPGDGVTKTVTVTNNSGNSQDIIVDTINEADSGLGEALNLVIFEGESELYNNTLANFLTSGVVSLSNLNNNNTTVYSFTVSFDSEADNSLQEGNLGFDLCVGFSGGTILCDGSNGGGGDSGGGDGSGGGGDSGGDGPGGGGILPETDPLTVFNERILYLNIGDGTVGDGTALVVWETNRPATSQVVFGPAYDSQGDLIMYSLDLTETYFGYARGVEDKTQKTVEHAMLIKGLTAGNTYKYRAISRASSLTMSFENQFELIKTTDILKIKQEEGISENVEIIIGGEDTAPKPPTFIAQIPDESIVVEDIPTETPSVVTPIVTGAETKAKEPVNVAMALFAMPEGLGDLFLCALPWLIIILLIISLLYWITHKFFRPITRPFLFFLIGTIIAYILSVLFMNVCVLFPLFIFILILLILVLSKRYK